MEHSSTPTFGEVLAALAKYLATPMGAVSVAPAAISFLDIWLVILPISVLVKPAVYILLMLSVLFGVYLETARYINVDAASPGLVGMTKRATFAFVVGVGLFIAFIVGSTAADEFLPSSRTAIVLLAWLCAALLAGAVFAFTGAFVTLGLRSYIAIHRRRCGLPPDSTCQAGCSTPGAEAPTEQQNGTASRRLDSHPPSGT